MAERKPARKTAKKTAKKTTTAGKFKGFSPEERAAMKEYAQELKAQARAERSRADGEKELLAKIAEMKEPDRGMAKRLHAIVTAEAPSLMPQTWYGMPAYAKNGKVLCFFQSAQKFKARYATLGFNDSAKLDDGSMWPISFALKKMTGTEETRIRALVKKAVKD
jgi:uncharacterized protein YdhG (YjbR/CyaY superfamily)